MTKKRLSFTHHLNFKGIEYFDSVSLNEYRIAHVSDLTELLDDDDLCYVSAVKTYNDRAKRWETTTHIYFDTSMYYSFDEGIYNRVKTYILNAEIAEGEQYDN